MYVSSSFIKHTNHDLKKLHTNKNKPNHTLQITMYMIVNVGDTINV
jgi:hypothetical protein